MIDDDVVGVYSCRFCGGKMLFRPVRPGADKLREDTELECIACNNRIGTVGRMLIEPGKKPHEVRDHMVSRGVDLDGRPIRVPVLSREARVRAWKELCELQGRADEAMVSTLPPDGAHQQAMREVQQYSARRSS